MPRRRSGRLVAADIPNLPASIITSGQLPIIYGGTGAADAQNARLNILPAIAGQANKALVVNPGETDFTYATVGTGSVTSIGLTGTANEITVTGTSPITTSGSWALSLPTALTFTGKTITGGAFTGGTWDNGIIGGSTAAAGTFTALTATTSAVVSVNTSSDALRITQVGSGNALRVEDSASPDTTPFIVDANGSVFIISETALTVGGANNQRLQIAGGDGQRIVSGKFTNDTAGASVFFLKSRSTTLGSFSIVNSGDTLFQMRGYGDDGTSYGSEAARIAAEVDGTPGTNDMPGRLVFSTTADGSASVTERMRITNNGTIVLGAAPGSESARILPVASAVNRRRSARRNIRQQPYAACGRFRPRPRSAPDAEGHGLRLRHLGRHRVPDNTTQTTAATAGLSLAQVQAAAVSL